ncbi:alanine/glycine:cation symporter family protein [Ichthyobacterium seriolicida]|uniref:Na(+)-linked D-alanine glycine permease n=1 Tax=Ichthyobacterium seriolicida TaxID=242600 RepID=A0A1J1DWJ1_9FLAO|nr:alanine/glycine:cation symporter family protein [Ichthyobacterium seriolicida]BAV94231.1 Na(+)-linked D-alanine glycine permease [Ichthyobacterium seriolicida]
MNKTLLLVLIVAFFSFAHNFSLAQNNAEVLEDTLEQSDTKSISSDDDNNHGSHSETQTREGSLDDVTSDTQQSKEEESLGDKIESVFAPIVEVMQEVFFWDPLSFLGLYDPIVYDEHGKVVIDNIFSGTVNANANSHEIEGNGTNFLELSEGDNIVLGGNLYEIEKILNDKSLTLKSPVLSSVEHENFGFAKKTVVPIILLWLVFAAVFFTIRLGFINLRGMRHALDLLRGKYENPDDKGEVSPFQALATALSGTVGLGNIAGVAIAVSVGGPGATFWMIAMGMLGMALKFAECMLGVKYRVITDGVVNGGPMYYISKGLENRNFPLTGKAMAVVFSILAVITSFGGGNMFQANQAFAQLANKFPQMEDYGVVFGIGLALLIGVVILGGIKSIAKVTEKIVPFMAGFYMLVSFVIILAHYDNIWSSFILIFEQAFNADSMKGGFIGVMVVGFQRAAFSNEAGVGSAPIAHSAVKTEEPVSEGVVALLEPFIDTVIICTTTALVIIITGRHEVVGLEGVELTSSAFESVFPWFSYALIIVIFLFAFSTAISWSYYGLKAWTYLFGTGVVSESIYKSIFLIFIVIGSSSSIKYVLAFSDIVQLLMSVPNIIGLLILSNEINRDKISYFLRVKSGEIKRFKK